MKKKLISLFMAITMIITVLPLGVLTFGAAETTTAAVISVYSTYAMKDSDVEVSLIIKNNPGILGMTLKLEYDENKAELTAVKKGDALDYMTFTTPQDLRSGCQLPWDAENVSEEDVKDGEIAILTFHVKDTAENGDFVNIRLSYNRGAIIDNDMNAIVVGIDNGTIQIIDYIPGDLNGDGIVNTTDVVFLRRFVAGGYNVTINEAAADVNDDGLINTTDAVYIRRYIAGGYGVKLKPSSQRCNHELVAFERKEATCTENGNEAYWSCTKCGKCFSDDAAENEVSHESTILKAAHNEIVKEAVPATSTSEGYTEGIWCDRCNTWLSGHERIEPIKPNKRSITYNIVNEAKHPYLKTLQIDVSALDFSYVPGETKVLKNLDLGKYGYTFDGWYDGFGDGAAQIKEIPASATENIELYAHVTEMVYDITYNLYQTPVTSAPSSAQQHYTVSKGNSNLYNPEINNYKFLGWYDNDGTEYKTIPIGTTGNITLNAYYTSLRNLAVSKNDSNPIILEDQNTNVVYFTYEIGEIRNIPLNADKPFWEIQSVAGLSQQVSETYTTSITNSEAENVSKTISDMTSNSSTWTLSENWNDVTTVNETWAKSIQKDTEVCKTEATTSSGTLSISAQNGGSTYHKTEDGSTVYDYDTKTVTNDKGHQFDASLSGNYTNKTEVSLGASSEYGATDSYGYTSKSKDNEYNHSASGSDKDAVSSGIKYENGFEVNAGLKYGYHNNTNTVTKTGTDKVTVNSEIDENTSSWNYAGAFSSTQQHSTSQTVRNALSDIVTTTKGYGNSYSKGGSDTKTQGFSSTASNTTGTSSSVTYSKLESKTTTSTYSVDGKIEGKYRSILVGKAHVFAVVGYDYATKSYFTYTFSVMDDKVEEFLDYTPKGGSFDDCEYSCLPFEIPYDVFEYVSGRTSKTTGVQYITDSLNGTAKVTGYVGESKDVIIPSYVSDGKQAYKVTEISGKAFAGKSVRSVSLGEFITEIPDGAFKNCTMLEEVVGSFTSIGNEAFSGCVNLTNINIPSNVVKIGTDAFVGAKSISVRAVNSLASYTEAVQQLPDASDEEIRAKQKEITQEFIKAILDSGAQNIVLDISYIAEGTPLSLTVPKIESIEINGGTKTYNDFRIDSSAENTTLNELTVVDSRGTPIKVDSGKLTLRKVFVNSNTTAVILKRDGAILSLSQDSAVKTNSSYAIIGKNLVIESQVTADGASGYLGVTGNLGYVNSINGEDYANIKDGSLKEISEEEFAKYILGQSVITFDVNGGKLDDSELSRTVFYGEKIGALPVPTRDYYSFVGWYASDGTQVTEDTVISELDDVTVKAHWLSGWVTADSLPENASIDAEKWTYTLREYTEQSTDSYSGWTKYDTKRTSWGTTQGPVYSNPSNGYRNVWSEQYVASTTTHYTFYHRYGWGYNTSTGKNSYVWGSDSQLGSGERHEIDLTYDLSKSSNFAGNSCWKGYTCPHCGQANVWLGRSTYVAENKADRWYYQEPVYTYYYYRDVSQEAMNKPDEQENISNVQKWVKYIVK